MGASNSCMWCIFMSEFESLHEILIDNLPIMEMFFCIATTDIFVKKIFKKNKIDRVSISEQKRVKLGVYKIKYRLYSLVLPCML